ncbi:MAG TPA: hypothetical protein VMH33_07000 [Solirubrobacterales bacterium]|nr:hypothetical protein [Solirubrobacterales bacterium]
MTVRPSILRRALLRLGAIGLGMILVPAATASGAVTVVEGEWGARTSDALPVSFQVKEGQVVDAHFAFAWGFCGDFESALPNTDPIAADGSWSFLDSRGPKIEATFVAADRVEGKVIAPSRELPGCPKTEATFVGAPGPVPPPLPIRISDGRGRLESRPRRITITGAAVRYAYDLHWRSIGPGRAEAKGRAFIRAKGRTFRLRVWITLNRAIDRDGYRTYRVVNYHLLGKLPAGISRWGSRPLS